MHRLIIHALAWTLVCFSQTSTAATLNGRLSSDWTKIQIGCGVDPGCTEFLIPEAVFITRDKSGIFLCSTTANARGVTTYSASKSLTREALADLLKTLEVHYKIAENEIDGGEYFSSLPEAKREIELREYFKTHGQPIGGFGGLYIVVMFYPDGPNSVVLNAFEARSSFEALYSWIRKLKPNQP